MKNFPIIFPIWNFSDFQFFSVFHQKRVRRFFKKDNYKTWLIFNKNKLLVQRKDVFNKNTWKIFQYFALFETFWPCNTFPFFIKSLWRLFKKNLKSLIYFQRKSAFALVERRLKKTPTNFPVFCPIGNFSDLYYIFPFFIKSVLCFLLKNKKSLLYFQQKKTFLLWWKDVYKNTAKIFQYFALLETF